MKYYLQLVLKMRILLVTVISVTAVSALNGWLSARFLYTSPRNLKSVSGQRTPENDHDSRKAANRGRVTAWLQIGDNLEILGGINRRRTVTSERRNARNVLLFEA